MRAINILKEKYNKWRIKPSQFEVHEENIKNLKRDNDFSASFPFQSLAPSDESDKEKIYSSALKSAFEKEDIFNIGLTGNYGSGKSSVLKSFESRYGGDYNLLNISLATFETKPLSKHNLTNSSPAQLSTQELELSILQQILYIEAPKNLKFTRINRIKKIPKWKIFSYAIVLVLWIHSCVFIIEPNFLEDVDIWGGLSWNDYGDVIKSISWYTFSMGAIFIIYRLIWTVRGATLSRFKLKGSELELNHNEHSIINKYLDEILYFFEETKIDTVVIEDLDRHDDDTIFAKLRELNKILNSSVQVDRKIRFVYAVKDNLFKKPEDRTKFFDIIIPIIPVVNKTNSGNKLYEWLESSGFSEKLKKQFLLDISGYISDMRMLKNIFNEFLIYEKVIGKDLITEKLLGIIIYKNLFPADFELIHVGKARLNHILQHKTVYTNSKIASLRAELRQNKKAETDLKSQFEQIEINDYKDKLHLIHDKRKKLLRRIGEEKSWSIGKIFLKDYEEFETSFSSDGLEVKIEPLTKYLIEWEYIDENFENYISYFYTGIFTEKESLLLQSIRTNQKLDPTVKIQNTAELVSKLDLSHFRTGAVLNITILDFLLSRMDEFQPELEAIFFQSKHKNSNFTQFLKVYLIKGNQLDDLFRELTPKWFGLWQLIISSDELFNRRYTLLVIMVRNVPFELLKNQNQDKCLKDSIDNMSHILRLWPEDLNDSFIALATEIEVKFTGFVNTIKNPFLLTLIYEYDLYDLTFENVQFMMKEVLDCSEPDKLVTSHLTEILNSNGDDLIEYIKLDLDSYINDVYLKLPNDQNENEDILIEILNNDTVELDTLNGVINKNSTRISTPEKIENGDIVLELFKSCNITADWKNVYYYYSKFELISTELIAFYNGSYEQLKQTIIPSISTDESEVVRNKISKDIVYSNQLPPKVYAELMRSLPYYFNTLELERIDDSHLKIMISCRKIRLTKSNYFKVKKHHPKLVVFLFENAIHTELEEILEAYNIKLASEDFRELLKSDELSLKTKIKLIRTKARMNLDDHEGFANDLCQFLVTNNIFILRMDIINAVLRSTTILSAKLSLLNSVLHTQELSGDHILSLLKESGKPFNRVNIKGRGSFNVVNNETNKNICELLKRDQIISSYKVNKDKGMIRVNRKSKTNN